MPDCPGCGGKDLEKLKEPLRPQFAFALVIYSLVHGGQESDLRNSGDVFKAVSGAGEDKRLSDALFRR